MNINHLSYNKATYFSGFVGNPDNFVTGFVLSFQANAALESELKDADLDRSS